MIILLTYQTIKENSDMLKKRIVVLFLVLGFGLTYHVHATNAQGEPKFTVLSTKFVESVKGVNDKGAEDRWSIKDPKAGLILIMSVKVEVDSDSKFLTSDFSARYQQEGEPAMADCIAITQGTSSQDTQGRWLIGNCGDKVCKSSEQIKKGTTYFQLAFEPIEPDIKVVDLDYAKPVVKQIKIR